MRSGAPARRPAYRQRTSWGNCRLTPGGEPWDGTHIRGGLRPTRAGPPPGADRSGQPGDVPQVGAGRGARGLVGVEVVAGGQDLAVRAERVRIDVVTPGVGQDGGRLSTSDA